MANNNIDIAIRAKNEASAALKQVRADVIGLEKSVGGIDIGGGLTGLLAGGAIGLGLTAVTGAVTQAASTIFDLSRQAANVSALKTSFDDLAESVGQSSNGMLGAMRTASQGMISDQELILSANRAMMLGVADSGEEMAQLLEVAAVRGKAMGLTTAQAFSDLVTGIGRMSPLILDNLGIVTGGEKVFNDYAASLGRTAESLTDVERKQALLNKVIAETDTSAQPVVNQFERMDAAIQNAKVALGELFGPAVAQVAQQLADAVTEVTDRLSDDGVYAARTAWADTTAEIVAAKDRLAELLALQNQLADVEPGFLRPDLQAIDPADINAQVAAQQALVKSLDQQAAAAYSAYLETQGLTQITVLNRQATWDAAVGWDKFSVSADAASAAAARHAAMAAQVRAQLAALAGQADITGNALKSAWIAAAGALGASQAMAGFAASQKELQSLTQEWQYMGLTAEEIEFRKAELVQNTSTGISDQVRAIKEVTQATGGQASAVQGVSDAYGDLQSKVSSLLSSQLDAGVGVSAADLLPREDEINENARRLADIAVNGLNNQEWLDAFMLTAPETWAELMQAIADGADAKGAAAQILRDFEDGLQTDLIDKTKAKERVKRMILGEQSMAALAEEIAAELAAEMGIPIQQALAAAGSSLGVTTGAAGEAAGAGTGPGDMTGTGASAGQTFVAGFSANADGALIVAGIVAKMTAEFPRFYSNGASAGTQWGAGFMGTVETGIAQPLITLLTALVTPGVLAALQTGQTQTAAP